MQRYKVGIGVALWLVLVGSGYLWLLVASEGQERIVLLPWSLALALY